MNVRKASIAFTEPAPLARHRRPKLLPEAIQALSEKAGAYMEESGIPALFEPREGQQVRLAGGDSSSTFLSARHGRVVEKFYNNQAEALHEWRMVQCVMALTPQYTASPASLSMGSGQQAHNSGLYYILTTQYAGDMLVTRLDERRLDADEFRLCLLQAIHFALLLGNTSVLVHDIHPINICVRNAGSQIEVRWIDFVTWKKEPTRNEPSYDSDILCKNATLLLQPGAWSTGFNCADMWTQDFVNGLLRRISGSGAQASDALQVLLEVADGLLKRIRTEEPAMYERGASLQAQIRAEAVRQQALCNEAQKELQC